MLTTKQKVRLASLLSRSLILARRLVGRSPVVEVNRQGANWCLDLREGIDLALYLNGYRTIPSRALEQVTDGDSVIDVGANIGACTLELAQRVGDGGRVFALEPTVYAYGKLQRNLALNPAFNQRVVAWQAFSNADSSDSVPEAVPSSWPLDASGSNDLDPVHCGRDNSTEGARNMSLNDVLPHLPEGSVLRLVKIDVDGHELEVLKGAREVLRTHQPVLVIEIAPYVYRDDYQVLDDILELLVEEGYGLEEADSGARVEMNAKYIRSIIPEGAGTDFIGRKVDPA